MVGLTRRRFVIGGGAILAPAVLRFGPSYLHAQELGLIGDGQTNDLPVLRRMLAEADRNGKGIIRLPAGRFWLSSENREPALTLPANVRLEGAGVDRTTLVMADGAFGHVINAPYGWVQIADLTVDGNEANRLGTVGHNLRLTGDHITVERVRVLNSVSYGIGIGQRRFARNVVIRNVEIVNAGADGIDIKNDLDRTENILIENVVVKGFGRPLPSLPARLVGSKEDIRGDKAGVDLRGKCEVRGLTILGVLPDRDGLRFRHGERGEGHGAGAHGSTASSVVVRGGKNTPVGTAISVVARDVLLEDVDIAEAEIGIFAGAANLTVTRGRIGEFLRAPIFSRPTHVSKPDHIQLVGTQFARGGTFVFRGLQSVKFDKCVFADCRANVQHQLGKRPEIVLNDCEFASSC